MEVGKEPKAVVIGICKFVFRGDSEIKLWLVVVAVVLFKSVVKEFFGKGEV